MWQLICCIKVKCYVLPMDSDNSVFSTCKMGLKCSPDVFGYLSIWKSFLLCNRKKICLTKKTNSIMPPFPCINKKVGVVILCLGKEAKMHAWISIAGCCRECACQQFLASLFLPNPLQTCQTFKKSFACQSPFTYLQHQKKCLLTEELPILKSGTLN